MDKMDANLTDDVLKCIFLNKYDRGDELPLWEIKVKKSYVNTGGGGGGGIH